MTVSPYDDIAEWYDAWVGTHSMDEDAFFPAVEALMGAVAGQRICDLACGHLDPHQGRAQAVAAASAGGYEGGEVLPEGAPRAVGRVAEEAPSVQHKSDGVVRPGLVGDVATKATVGLARPATAGGAGRRGARARQRDGERPVAHANLIDATAAEVREAGRRYA